MANKFKKNDEVIVISGKDKNKRGVISRMLLGSDQAFVKGVNVVKKHLKPNKANPDGGIISKEMPIHVSNLMHYDVKSEVKSKIGYRVDADMRKVRFYKKTGIVI